jgi:hypothetical protein
MKKLMMATVLCSLSTFVMAKKYGPAGCGLGSVLFKGKRGTLWNVSAATTNGSSGNQTFGMTSGTSGCKVTAKTKVSQINFIEANKFTLANDIARGQGQTLATLGALYECQDVATMASALKDNYKSIFKAADMSAEAINNNIESVLDAKKACI